MPKFVEEDHYYFQESNNFKLRTSLLIPSSLVNTKHSTLTPSCLNVNEEPISVESKDFHDLNVAELCAEPYITLHKNKN